MERAVRRRKLLRAPGVSLGFSAGCTEPLRSPWRQLSFGDVRVKATNGGWQVSFELQKQYRAADRLGTFHDVRVHGYDGNRSEVCTKELGTIANKYYGGNGLPIEMECSEFPTMLTYSAEESPCDEEITTQLHIAVYRDDHGWLHDFYARDCGEGLPPEPRGGSGEV